MVKVQIFGHTLGKQSAISETYTCETYEIANDMLVLHGIDGSVTYFPLQHVKAVKVQQGEQE